MDFQHFGVVVLRAGFLYRAAGSSTSHPEVVNASVLTRFSASAPQSQGSDPALYEMSYSELATEALSSSSSESLGFSAPRGERSSESPSTEPHPEEGGGLPELDLQ